MCPAHPDCLEVNVDSIEVMLTPERAAVIDRTAVIADLHLGFENAMREAGVAFPRVQIAEIKATLEKLFERGIRKLAVAGDLKHEFSRNLPCEWKDVEEFVEFVDAHGVELVVVRGNHDNYLAAILKKYGMDVFEKLEIGDLLVVHGHKNFDLSRPVVMGHEHPAVKLRVRGGIYSYPCFLKLKNVLVLPPFSPLVSGSDVLSLNAFLSPALKSLSVKEAEVYAVYGGVFYLGRVEDLMKVSFE